jgi:acyl dehydratase
MTLNPDAIGSVQEAQRHSWTSKDTLLYALGVGAGADQLAFTTENTRDVAQRVLPTYAVLAAHPGYRIQGVGDFDPAKLVHGGQEIVLHDAIPASGEVEVSGVISAMQDKGPGKHAVIDVSTEAKDVATGTTLVSARYTMIVRGAGGFGGPTAAGGSPSPTIPDTPPDLSIRESTRPDQALLYRLSGDRNPLHSDPWFAKERAGFPRPILHGLCTYGFAGRTLLRELCGDDVSLFGLMSGRFSAPVYPGDGLTTHIWHTEGGAVFRTLAGSDLRGVIDDGVFAYR